MTIAKRLVAESRIDLNNHRRRSRGEEMRDQLLQQIAGEFGKFMLELELHSGREKCRTFKQSTDQRVDAVFENASKPIRNPWIFLSELACLFVQQLELPIVEIEKFAVHTWSQPIDDNFSAFDNIGDKLHRYLYRIAC